MIGKGDVVVVDLFSKEEGGTFVGDNLATYIYQMSGTGMVIDGAIRNPGRTEPPDRPDSMLDPDAIAASYLHLLQQPRSAWTWEVELRPWVERF